MAEATSTPLPSNITATATGGGTGPVDAVEQVLQRCEKKTIPEAEAQKVVDWLDQTLNGKLDPTKKKRYLLSLMKICKVYSFVPTSHLIPDDALEKVGDPLEGQPDVWPGSYTKPHQKQGEEPMSVSIKVLPRYFTELDKIRRNLCREAVVWKRMSHPNILPFIGVTLSEELAIVYPWMENGNVLDYLKENQDANPVKLLEESVVGLKYLHSTGLVHGDLRAQHILVTDDGHACLANIGHSSVIREQGDSGFGSLSATHEVGCNWNLPPEYFSDDLSSKHATKQGDIYSMGMTIYETLTDKRPFETYTSISVVMPIVNGMRPSKPNFAITRGYTEELWQLSTTCWKNPTERPTIGDILGVLKSAASKWKSPTANSD